MVKIWSSVAQRWGYRWRITEDSIVYDFIAEVYGEGTKI
jgi:hypothetical protein